HVARTDQRVIGVVTGRADGDAGKKGCEEFLAQILFAVCWRQFGRGFGSFDLELELGRGDGLVHGCSPLWIAMMRGQCLGGAAMRGAKRKSATASERNRSSSTEPK